MDGAENGIVLALGSPNPPPPNPMDALGSERLFPSANPNDRFTPLSAPVAVFALDEINFMRVALSGSATQRGSGNSCCTNTGAKLMCNRAPVRKQVSSL